MKNIFFTTLISFVLVSGFGFLHVFTMPDHGHEHCPFMEDIDVLCGSDLLAHIRSWQSKFLYLIPSFSFLWIVSLFFVIYISLSSLRSPPLNLLNLYQVTRKKVVSLEQILFSQGILNPKSP